MEAEKAKTAAAEDKAGAIEEDLSARLDETVHAKDELEEQVKGLSEKLTLTIQEAQAAMEAEKAKTTAAEEAHAAAVAEQGDGGAGLQAELLAAREELAVSEDREREKDDRLHDLGEQMKA